MTAFTFVCNFPSSYYADADSGKVVPRYVMGVDDPRVNCCEHPAHPNRR